MPQRVVDDIAEAFRALEHERRDLESFHTAAAAVDRFLETYRRYVQVAVRQRSDTLRSAHTGYDDAQRALRRSEQSLAGAVASLEQAERELAQQKIDRAGAEAEASALEQSEDYRDANALADRKRRAENAAEGERLAGEEVERAGRDAQRKGEAVEAAARTWRVPPAR